MQQAWLAGVMALATTTGTVTGEPPPTVAIGVEREHVVVTFSGVLQAARNVDGPWADVPGARSPWAVDETVGTRIFRARWTSSIFDSREPLAMTLTGPLQKGFDLAKAGLPDGIFPPIREKPYADGLLQLPGFNLPVRWRVRGNSSLQECPFPKLKFKASREDRAGTPFLDAREIKIGTHCAEGGRGTIGRLRDQTATYREALAYEVMELLGFAGPRVRRVQMQYVDTTAPAESGGTGWQLTRSAVLLEDIEVVAERLGGTVVEEEDAAVLTAANFDRPLVTELQFLHVLLGNWDYSLGTGTRGLWNCDVVAFPDGRLMPVAGDFDLASWVTGVVRASFPHEYHPELDEMSRQAHFDLERIRGETTAEEFAAAGGRFQMRRDTLERWVEEVLVDDPGRENARRHLTVFFDTLAVIRTERR